MAFRLLGVHEDQPLQQFLVSCAYELSQRMATIDARFRDGARPVSAARQWVLSGLESLAHMKPNAWYRPRRAPQPTPDMWALAHKIEGCQTLDELLALEAEIKRAAIALLLAR